MNCLFCKIVNGEIESKKVYEDDLVIAIMDAYPDVDGHTLIIPKMHYNDFKQLDKDIIIHIMKVANILEERYAQVIDYSGISFLWNYKDSQAVKHFHLHILPDLNRNKASRSIDEMYEILKSN